jgi:hypothetical protein
VVGDGFDVLDAMRFKVGCLAVPFAQNGAIHLCSLRRTAAGERAVVVLDAFLAGLAVGGVRLAA